MINRISDPDVALLAGIAMTLTADYAAGADDPWEGSPFLVVLLLGLSPFAASCWVVPKAVIVGHPLKLGLSHQHGGRRGQDTIWLRFRASNPPEWLSSFGGSLAQAFAVLAQ